LVPQFQQTLTMPSNPPKQINKWELVRLACAAAGAIRRPKMGDIKVPCTQARRLVNAFLQEVKNALNQGTSVELRGFGRWDIKLAKPRIGRNPKKPQLKIVIPARKAVKFKPFFQPTEK
jgi:nucleoid DNA-binding protein